jgi:hypothetical protein
MAPENTPVDQMSEEAIAAILAAGGASDNSAQIHVHAEMNHLCITLVGTANTEGPNGFVMFCDMAM